MHRSRIYRPSLALLTDLYQLTMASGYFQHGLGQQESVFHLFFRKNPFKGGYAVAAGLADAVDYLRHWRLDDEDLHYLASIEGSDGRPLFEAAFIGHLAGLRFSCDIDAVPEGTVVFPHEPLLRVRGPLVQCQLLETPLLNMINFQTLIATKAARVCDAAAGDAVLEFGLRRAQGVDGALSASRAAWIGGCAASSNVLAGRLYGIPVKGTHAHSWVMCFDTELEAFQAYAEAMPNNCVFLVDTYDTLEGVRHAVQVGHWLRERGHEMVGIRLDSGDLAHLAKESRRILDEGGFPQAAVVASNDLDEHLITSLKAQGAPIAVWGVGTRLVTAYDQPALGGVYKLAATREEGEWEHRIKLSEQAIKISTPGILQVQRYSDGTHFRGDLIWDELTGRPEVATLVDPLDHTRRRRMDAEGWTTQDLLVPVFRQGRCVWDEPELSAVRARVRDQLAHLHPTIRRFVHPHEYPVGLEEQLYELKSRMVLEARSQNGGS